MRLVPCVVVMLSLIAAAAAESAPLRFVDESGAPVNVAWLPEGPPSLARPVGDDGVLVRHDGEGTPQCVVHERFVPMALTAAMLEAGGDVVMKRGRTAQGRILSAAGAPIAGITLRVEGDDVALGACARRATSDAAGRFQLVGIGPKDDLVQVVAPPAWLAPPSVRLAQAAGLETVVKLHPATAIALTVAGADGQPLAGASARVAPEWKRHPLDPPAWKDLRGAVESWKGTTDATGRVALPPMPQRVIWRVVVEHPLHAPASVRAMAAKASVEAALTLKHGGGIELRAVDEAGLPLAGASARVVPGHDDDYDLVPKSPASSKDGILRLSRVPAGRVAVEVTAPGMRPSVARAVSVEDEKLASVGDVVLVPGVAIAGVVRSEGTPVEKASVSISGHDADGLVRCEVETAADGAFRCDGLDPELRATVEAKAEWHVSATEEHVPAGTTDLEIALEPAGAILVKAHDPDAAEDVADLGAALRRGEQTLYFPKPELDESSAGLRFRPLAPGTYKLAAWAPGYATAIRADVEVVAGEETVAEIDLTRGRSVSGRVVEAGTGRPVAGAHLALGRNGTDAISGDDGAFTVEGIKGPFRLIASHDAYPEVTVTVDPEALPADGLVVEMSPGGSVEGVAVIITGDESAPVPGAGVEAEPGERRTTTDAGGHYRLDGLPPGPAQITKTDRPGLLDGREVARADVVAGQVAHVDFGTRGTLRGVVRLGGEPLAGVTLGLLARPAAGSTDPMAAFMAASASTRSDAEGRYVLRGVAPGEHVLSVAWGGRHLSRDVTMPLTGRNVELDVDIPDLHVAGRVLSEGTDVPIAGVKVTLRPDGPRRTDAVASFMSGEDENGVPQMLEMTTEIVSSDETGPDGTFAVYPDHPGKHGLSASVDGFEGWSGDLDVTTSRDDMIISLKAKSALGKLRVELVDAATGDRLSGIVQCRDAGREGGPTIGSSEFEFLLPEQGRTATLIAAADGRAVEVREGVAGDGEGDTVVRIPLGAGGSLRVLAGEGALLGGEDPAHFHLKLASGFDVGPFMAEMSVHMGAHLISPVAPGEWLVGPLPPGALAVSIGDSAPRTVDVVAGDTVEVDLR
jgi:hypothetical protein